MFLLYLNFISYFTQKCFCNEICCENTHVFCKCIILILKTIGNRKGDCAWSCSRWQTQPEKIDICKSQRTNQCHSLRTMYWFVLCNLLIFSGCVCHLKQLHAQSLFLFPIVFSVNLIPFFDICSVGYLLFFRPVVRVCAALLGPLRGRNSCWLWFWQLVFGVSLRDGTSWSNLPSSTTPSQTEVCSTMGGSIRPSSIHNPTPSAKKRVVQICRSSLSAAVQTVKVSVELTFQRHWKIAQSCRNHKDLD